MTTTTEKLPEIAAQDVKLSTMQLIELASKLEGTQLKRTATKGDAINKLFTACQHRLGGTAGRKLHAQICAASYVDAATLVTAFVSGKTVKEAAKVAQKEERQLHSKRAAQRARTIHPLVNENPRRSESGYGYKSMQIILKKPGLTVEEFLKAGGRWRDLHWDVEKGNVRIDD
jgi:hypothetical protein